MIDVHAVRGDQVDPVTAAGTVPPANTWPNAIDLARALGRHDAEMTDVGAHVEQYDRYDDRELRVAYYQGAIAAIPVPDVLPDGVTDLVMLRKYLYQEVAVIRAGIVYDSLGSYVDYEGETDGHMADAYEEIADILTVLEARQRR